MTAPTTTEDDLAHLRRRWLVRGIAFGALASSGGGVAFFALGGPAMLRALVFDSARHEQASDECRDNLNILRTSEKAYWAEFDEYIPTNWAPIEPGGAGRGEALDFGMPEAFAQIGWIPDGRVHGTYRVQLTESGFEAECRMDLDRDGVWAMFRATEAVRAERLTPDVVY